MITVDRIQRAVKYRLVSQGYSPESAEELSASVFAGVGDSEAVMDVGTTLIDLFWPVISNPTIIMVIKSIYQAMDGVINMEIHLGAQAEQAAKGEAGAEDS